MDSQTTGSEPPAPGAVPSRAHFHIVLGLILVPYVAAAVGWTLAVLDVVRGYANRTQLTWSRVLVGLVIVDTLIAMGSIWMLTHKDEFVRASEASTAPKSYVGIQFQPVDDRAAPVIGGTAPGHPAEKAGLRSGDLILAIDQGEVKTQREAVDALIRGEPGKPRPFRIRRDGHEQDVEVVPSAYPRFGLFQVVYPGRSGGWLPDLRGILAGFIFAAAAWAVGWWRFGDRGKVWLGILLGILGADLLSFFGGRIIEGILGGISVGGALLALTVSASALLGLALLLRRIFREPQRPPLGDMGRPIVGTYFLGVFYLIAGGVRIGFLLLMADVLWFGGKGSSNSIQQMVQLANLGVGGTLLLLLNTVVLAPLGEELLFRGVLLPRLMAQKGPVWAVGVSAVFFALLHWEYGVYIPMIALYGVVLGWARIRSGGLVAPILLHLSINALATTMMLVR